jgi:hypothetical protein
MLTALILGRLNKQRVSSSKVHMTLVQFQPSLKLADEFYCNYSMHQLMKILFAF